ncbi:NAD(P)-dependent oxidoreductase [Neolewinella antarctica]|uniref:NADH-flavin reductase n=1 Tax=Neolewinella antarctica TaxID=442734 RepID=A0ABX0XB88_9BACT|nr:NAD(P)H-binding protein [Neolewinella antarctica]NJC26515.1 putative NADH-flavin reductase [Neolewinella antarctica]
MIIALFGGTGRTGQEFIPKALAAGHTLKILARTPAKVTVTHDRLSVTQGDILDAASVRQTIAGCDAVVSLIGQTKGGNKAVQTAGTRHLVAAMMAENVQRVISMSGGGLPYAKDEPKFIDKIFRGIMGVFFKSVISDATGHAEILQQSTLDWTIVRAPRLVEEADRGEYKVGYVGTTGGSKISRGDVASFVLKITEKRTYVRDMPFVSW